MLSDAVIGNTILVFLIVGAGAGIAVLYNESRERTRLLLIIGATVILSYSLAILLIEPK